MTELILSDITRMAGGFCVIGLEKVGDNYCSVRPIPPIGHAWPASFSYHRGDRLQFELSKAEIVRPHFEDRKSTGVSAKIGSVSEDELLACFRGAEVAARISDLFGCTLKPGTHGASMHAPKGRRSICGMEARKVRLKWEANGLRAHVALASGEVLPDLPVVDRSWHRFAEALLEQIEGANRGQRLNRYLGERLQSENCFLRLGLTRPHPPRFGRCQVMVDTLFPIPHKSWVREFVGVLHAAEAR